MIPLSLALHNNEVWADGLLVFYEVFKYIETKVDDNILPQEFRRTKAFEEDLTFYLGTQWQSNYEIRPQVGDYLSHLERINSENSILLLAYVYHLYMGLLSGGQILQKKRKVFATQENSGLGMAVTDFKDLTISELKSSMRTKFEELAGQWDEDTKQAILVEGRKVFELNNIIIGSVKNVNKVNLRLVGYVLVIFLCFVICLAMWNL